MKVNSSTRPFDSSNRKIASNENAIVIGSCLSNVLENGEGRVKRSTGTSADVFTGFAMDGQGAQTWATKTEVRVVPAAGPYTVTLGKTPKADADVSVVNGTALFTQGAVATTVYAIAANVLTFAAADAGKTIVVTYKYNITAGEYLAIADQQFAGRTPSDVIGVVAVMHTGYIYTDQFDSAVNWFAASIADVKTAANGLVTRGGAGVAISAEVVASPSANQPFLGLNVR
jgi:hypothetical protein